VLYGHALRTADEHRELSFMIVYEGLKQPAQMRAARQAMEKLIKRAAPIKRNINFIDDPSILEQIHEANPAVGAVFGQAIPIWTR
jgi:hypothetical protein